MWRHALVRLSYVCRIAAQRILPGIVRLPKRIEWHSELFAQVDCRARNSKRLCRSVSRTTADVIGGLS